MLFATANAFADGGMSYEYQGFKGKHPFSDTALLFAADDHNPAFGYSGIVMFDGKKTSGFWSPGRNSARVLPGTHTFVIRADWDHTGSITGSTTGVTATGSSKTLDVEIEVKDMKPLHVYVVRYHLDGEKLGLSVEDLGERAKYQPNLITRAAAF